jgi:hypothetical protein
MGAEELHRSAGNNTKRMYVDNTMVNLSRQIRIGSVKYQKESNVENV